MKKLLLVSLILGLLILSACESSDDKTKGISGEDRFVGGTEGLKLEFVENSPPNKVFTGNPFDISLRVRNVGDADVNVQDVKAKLSGIGGSSWGLDDGKETISPTGDLAKSEKLPDKSILPGGEAYIEYLGLNYGSETGIGNYPIRIELCYPYENTAETKLCILEDFRSDTGKICKLGTKTVYNSGGPVQISEIIDSQSGSGTSFRFTLTKKGTGTLYTQGTNCFPDTSKVEEVRETQKNTDWIFVDIDTKNEISGLKCSGLKDGDATSGLFRLGTGVVTCTLSGESVNNNRLQAIDIGVKYQYLQSVDKALVLE